jgi:hypothetical protein
MWLDPNQIWHKSTHIFITKNKIAYNGLYGVACLLTEDCIIEWNDLIDNNKGSCQAYDNGLTNIFKFNYWNDWTSPDFEDPIGIVDIPYLIDGTSFNNDPCPRTDKFDSPIQISILLTNNVNEMVDGGILNPGQGLSLTTKLELAVLKIIKGKIDVGCNLIQSFINQVYDFINNGIISQEKGESLITLANQIISQLSG